jgi:desulfoferrodoxin (superoxide reductase-like protein)
LGVLLCCLLVTAPAALADETAVRIQAPSTAAPDSLITVTVHVTHSGNNFFHFTEWVWLKANDTEIGRWEFRSDARPENENFTRQVSYRVAGPVTLTAQGNCNVHGSAGMARAEVAVGAGPGPKPARPASAAVAGRGTVAWLVLVLGLFNLLLCVFQVATGRRWIRVKIAVHRRCGQLLLAAALIHGLLALLVA